MGMGRVAEQHRLIRAKINFDSCKRALPTSSFLDFGAAGNAYAPSGPA